MGYGTLRIEFEALKEVFYLPDDCRIIGVKEALTGNTYIDLAVASPSFPDVPFGDEHPRVTVLYTIERPTEHKCPDGYEHCKKVTTKLEVSKH